MLLDVSSKSAFMPLSTSNTLFDTVIASSPYMLLILLPGIGRPGSGPLGSGLWRIVLTLVDPIPGCVPPDKRTHDTAPWTPIVGFGSLSSIQRSESRQFSAFGRQSYTLAYNSNGTVTNPHINVEGVPKWTPGTPLTVYIDTNNRQAVIESQRRRVFFTDLPMNNNDLVFGISLTQDGSLVHITSCLEVPQHSFTFPSPQQCPPISWPHA